VLKILRKVCHLYGSVKLEEIVSAVADSEYSIYEKNNNNFHFHFWRLNLKMYLKGNYLKVEAIDVT
jgi:hypothetical protein